MSGEAPKKLGHILEPSQQHETVAIARALCPFAEAVTDATMLLCVAMVEAKGDMQLVADELSYGIAQVRGHLQSRLAGQIMRKLAKEKITTVGYLKATSALMDIAASESQTGNARINASKSIIEMSDDEQSKAGGGVEDDVDLSSMTLKQLERYVGSIKQDLMALAPNTVTQTIEHEG